MSSTNKTTYYELPQFVDNDIFNPLVDDNDAYNKIDTALHNIANAEADDASEIVSIKSRLDSAEGDIDALEAQNGNSVLTTTAQTLSGAVNELDADVASLDGRVDIVEDEINNNSTGLKFKVNALETLTDSIYHGGVEDDSIEYNKLSVTAKKFLEDNAKIIFMKIDGDTAGNCTVVITKHGKVVMLDSGFNAMYQNIKEQLADYGITRVDYFLLSHYHADHYGNIGAMVQDGYIDTDTVCYLPRRTANGTAWNNADDEIRAILADMEKILYSSTSPLEVDGFTFSFFNCDASDYAYYDALSTIETYNIYCVCTYIESNNFTLLMTGDCTAYGIVHSESYFKKVDILQVPHHGYRAGASDLLLYMATRPDYAVVFMPSTYYTSEDDYLRTSSRLCYLTQMGIPIYLTGFTNIYVGIGDNDYCLLSSYMAVPAKNTIETLNLYVDKTYSGVGCGSQTRPFNTVTQALAYASQPKLSGSINIIVNGEYDGSDEELVITTPNPISIGGTRNGDVYSFKLKEIHVISSPYVGLNNIELKAAGTDIALSANYSSNVICNYIKIEGDSTSISNVYEGDGIFAANNSFIKARYCTISNRNVAMYVVSGGNILGENCSGSGNVNLCGGDNGGEIISSSNNIAYTGNILVRRYSGNVPLNKMRIGNGETLSYGYSPNVSDVVFSSVHDSQSTDNVRLDSQAYRSKIFRIYCVNGAVYQTSRVDRNALSTPIQINSAVDSSDPTFAVAIDSTNNNQLNITHSSMVKVIGM